MDVLQKLNSITRLWLGSATRREAAREIERLRSIIAAHEHNMTIMRNNAEALQQQIKQLKERIK